MDEIEVVIKIPKILYAQIQSDAEIMIYSGMRSWKGVLATLLRSVRNGTPQSNTWSLDDAREDFMYDVYNTLDFLPTNEEANRIIDSFDRVTSSIEQEPALDKYMAESKRACKMTKMTREEATEILLNTAFFGRSQEDIDAAIDIAVRCIKGWDVVIEKLPSLAHFESVDGVDLVAVYDVWQLMQNVLEGKE